MHVCDVCTVRYYVQTFTSVSLLIQVNACWETAEGDFYAACDLLN